MMMTEDKERLQGKAGNDDAVAMVEDVLTREGWRRVHFLSGNKKAFQEAWDQHLVKVPWESADAVMGDRYIEAGIEHGVILWPLRGFVVEYPVMEQGPEHGRMVMWVLTGKDERVSETVKRCAWYYRAYFDEEPDTAWVGKRMTAHDGKSVDADGNEIGLVCAKWMPELGIGIGRKQRVMA